MKNKTIFFLVGSFKVGGAEKVSSRMATNLIKAGYDVKILLLTNTIELPVDNLKQNIIHLNTQDYANRAVKIIVSLYILWKNYLKFKPHRIVSFSSELNILLFFSMLPNQVFRIDTNLFWVESGLYRRRILKIIGYLPHIKKVITPSHQLRLKFKNYLPARSYNKFVTIHNPLALDIGGGSKMPGDVQKPYLVSVGRLNINKGFEQLIRCFSKAKFKNDYFLYILGSGPMDEVLENLIQELKVGDRVNLLGFKENPKPYIAHADSLILNSSFESFGNVLVEALSLGVPVISNDCDFGPREIIEHGTNGLLYDKMKKGDLQNTLEEFVNSDSLREKLTNNTSYRLDRFSVDRITNEWIEKIIE